jgi:hypothetical protein
MLPNSAPAVPSRSRVDSPLIDHVFRTIARQFESTQHGVRDNVTHLWILLGIVLAGTWLRFWGLGLVGLHGDEETMAMAVRHILIDGQPTLPSGMFYPRGLTQLYLMAASVSIFGESEWSLRLPSALCGIALIGLSYLMGKRFLRPEWNLALAASVAFLPELILYSQTARMYIFLIACVTASMVAMFRWERTNELRWLALAVMALIVGMDMQLLAVGVVLMFLIPGLLQADMRKLFQGAVAVAIVLMGYVFIEYWTQAQYPVPPPEFAVDLAPPPWERSWAPPEFALTFDIALCVSGLMIAFFALQLAATVRVRAVGYAFLGLLLAGVVLQLTLFYHLAALCYAAGFLLAYRYRTNQTGFRALIVLFAIAIVALLHASLLASTPGSIVKLVGAMIGQPSVWPYIKVIQLTEAAGLLVVGLVIWGAYRFVHRKQLSDVWLLALLGVVAPVFALGFFAWNVPPRYTSMSLPPLLLCAFAVAQRAFDWLLAKRGTVIGGHAKWQAVAAALVATLTINPLAFASVVHAGYEVHPDHKGAAEFMRSVGMTDDDVVLAEDVLQQTFYLGQVDYWLIGPQVARKFIKREGDGVVDFYTGTPVIVTSAMLDAVLQKNQGKRVFVIGSGEDQRSQRRVVRGQDLHDALRSERFEVIHTGRDGLTQILRAVPTQVKKLPKTEAESQADEAQLLKDAEAAMESSAVAPKSVE